MAHVKGPAVKKTSSLNLVTGFFQYLRDEQEAVQKRTFTKWINSHLAKASVVVLLTAGPPPPDQIVDVDVREMRDPRCLQVSSSSSSSTSSTSSSSSYSYSSISLSSSSSSSVSLSSTSSSSSSSSAFSLAVLLEKLE
ncbi:hypothetical protein CRUP_038031 [Coryphaenoides rupestris]|nr:hypothetical protein CRUP_038031 [Coryphaenoides rupestris]